MLTSVGISHRNAPIDVCESLTVGADDLPELMGAIIRCFGAGAALVTCNRFEVYLPGSHERDGVLEFLVEEAGADAGLASSFFEYRRDEDAVCHLYQVAAGIDSMVLGESEILRQVGDAFSLAVESGADNSLISRLFHSAIRVGRRARAETEIGHHALSISSIAAQQARALHPDINRETVLVVGAGDAGRHAAESLADHGVGRMLVANRTARRAEALAGDLGGEAVAFEQLPRALADSDVVIAASGSAEHLVSGQQVAEAMAGRNGRPLAIIDIGLPRDFDPAVRQVDGVAYSDLDDLQKVVEEHIRAREGEVGDVKAIVDAETQRFGEWWEQFQVVPTIAALTERAEVVRTRELQKSLRRMDLQPGQSEQLEAMTRALVKQLLHDPISTLRERGDTDVFVESVRSLYRLDEPGAPAEDA
ncbi:MAG: glutamyl-tRNA reductase [Dehalococcoidia bacterium]|jgi:glutamyl-tRNA reductase|nr:glutamyl-tRNA reductase [Dehalococcoidia bacterium]